MPDEVKSDEVQEVEQDEPFFRILVRCLVTAIAACLVLVGIGIKVVSFQKSPWYLAIGSISFYVMMLVLFIFRHPIKESSMKPLHWFFALSGTLLPLAITIQSHRPPFLTWISLPIEIAGMCFSLIAIYTLGRSFGIIAANREVKTHGVYKIIRHPLYLGEGLWLFALVLQNISLFNMALFMVQSACQAIRILEEEQLLQKDDTYNTYKQTVPWRIIPGIF